MKIKTHVIFGDVTGWTLKDHVLAWVIYTPYALAILLMGRAMFHWLAPT
jgi:hypothetical protein